MIHTESSANQFGNWDRSFLPSFRHQGLRGNQSAEGEGARGSAIWVRLWRRAYCREAVTRRAEEEPRRRTSVSFFLWRTTEQAGVPLGGFARKNGRWVGLRLFAFRWADSISQFEPSYIHTIVRRTHTNTHTLHAYMTGGPCHLGAQGGCPACQHYRAGPGCILIHYCSRSILSLCQFVDTLS